MAKPNILFLMCDDRRHDTIAALGNDGIRTPHTDWLVENGTAFTHAFNPGGMSSAVCMPSRAMMHTGRHLFHISGAGEAIPTDHTLLGEALQAAGYDTHGIGKWHNGKESFNRSFGSGAEIFFGGMADHWNVPLFDCDPSGRYDKQLPVIDDPLSSNTVRLRQCDHIYAGHHSTDIIGDAAVRYLSERNADEPYLLYVSFLAPHDPRSTHAEYQDMYPSQEIMLPPNCVSEHPFDNGDLDVRDELLADRPRRPEEIRKHVAEYYAMITHMDAQFGRIIDAVRCRGDLDNTIFVHCADHGLAVGQHGLMGKQNLYDHSVRVPLIFSGAGVPKGNRVDEMVMLMDVFPTLCDLAGVETPGSVEGQSVLPAMNGGGGRDKLFFAYLDVQRGIRTEKWKLIEYFKDGQHSRTQLFNVAAAPWEMRDLSGEESCAGTVSSLRAEMAVMGIALGDPLFGRLLQ
ncbi:MAG TPA: sulfatase-like hydrolase/transferase [Capsulimonadaceae bacterium]|jgi:arylsulfatase A-like enzyme